MNNNLKFWDKARYVKLAKDNPVKFLIRTHEEFFKAGDGESYYGFG